LVTSLLLELGRSALASVQSGASRNLPDAGRLAPFSAPLGTIVGTISITPGARSWSSVPVAWSGIAVSVFVGSPVGTAGNASIAAA